MIHSCSISGGQKDSVFQVHIWTKLKTISISCSISLISSGNNFFGFSLTDLAELQNHYIISLLTEMNLEARGLEKELLWIYQIDYLPIVYLKIKHEFHSVWDILEKPHGSYQFKTAQKNQPQKIALGLRQNQWGPDQNL